MIFPLRHMTLGMSFTDPSPAMEAWVMVDLTWHDQKEYISCAGAPMEDAVLSADAEAEHYHQKGN